MAPTEIHFELKGIPTGEVLKVDPSDPQDLHKIMSVIKSGTAKCDTSDDYGKLMYEGNPEYVRVSKTSGGFDLNSIIMPGQEVVFRGNEGVRISSSLLDASIHITHRKKSSRGGIGPITGRGSRA